MSDHECSVYCRPDEGVHCILEHVWSGPGTTSVEDGLASWAADIASGSRYDRPSGGRIFKIERAAEAPWLLTEAKRVAYIVEGGKYPPSLASLAMRIAREWFYLGPVLLWHRVEPAEVAR